MTATRVDRDLSHAEIRWIVEQACRAPSLHNSQPWRFRYAGGAFELWADTARGLTVTDPDGRELVLSCSAALYNLRLAARKIGFDPTVVLLPDTKQPRLLARINVREGKPAEPDERHAYAALTRRHTHRGRFDDRPLAPDLAVYLQEAADAEGAMLVYVHQPGQRRHILQLATVAERELATDPRVQAETEQWTPQPEARRRDGVPAAAYPARLRAVAGELPGRDFDQGRGYGHAEPNSSTPGVTGVIGVLATAGDTQRDWMIAGQAMERVLVRAAQDWAFAALDSQVIELPNLRAEVRRELGTSDHPQILLRFGYASDAAATPRRPVEQVLDISGP